MRPGNAPEEWRTVPGFGMYEISTRGSVRRGPTFSATNRHRVGDEVRLGLCAQGRYRVVGLRPTQGARQTWVMVHRLVAAAFLGPCPAGCVVNHRDSDTHNNRVENLEYISQRENIAHALKAGRFGRCSLTEDQVREARSLRASGVLQREIAARFGVTKGAICKLLSGKSYAWVE